MILRADVFPGDHIKSNDPRYPNRVEAVVEVTKKGIKYKAGRRLSTVSFEMLFTPNQKHRNRGWTLLS